MWAASAATWRQWIVPCAVGAPILQKRVEKVPPAICDIAWAAQVRLCARFRRLAARKLPHNKVVVAIARELAGFVWAIMQAAQPLPH